MGTAMEGTVKACKELGYTDAQAELIGEMDSLFEKATGLGLVSKEEATGIGQAVGMVMGRRTGKLFAPPNGKEVQKNGD